MNRIILDTIVLLHFIFILFVVLTPFIGGNYFLLLHAIIVPFIVFHWIINNNTCALTIAERAVRKQLYGTNPSDDDCITYKLIAPVYDFNKNNISMSNMIYVIILGLWGITLFRLYSNYSNGKLSNMNDLFTF
jgi:hypothetical protein